jgi:hypothetical protein
LKNLTVDAIILSEAIAMARRETQQPKKQTTVVATTVALPLSPSAAPAGRKTAGVSIYQTPEGLIVIRPASWSKIVCEAVQQCKSSAEVAAFLSQKAEEFEQRLKVQKQLAVAFVRLWLRTRKFLQQRRSFKPSLVRPSIVRVLTRPRERSPTSKRKANMEDAEGDADSHSERWFASVIPLLARAPTFTTFVAANG